MAWNSDGKRLASAHDDERELTLWDVKTGQVIRRVYLGLGFLCRSPHSMAWSPDNRTIATAEAGGVALSDMMTGQIRWLRAPDPKNFDSVTWSPDGKTIAGGGMSNGGGMFNAADPIVKLWDVRSGNVLHTMSGPDHGRGVVRSLAWSPDGKTLAFGIFQGSIELRDIPGGNRVLPFGVFTDDTFISLAWSPDSKTLAAGTVDEIKLWNFAHKVVRTIKQSNIFSPFAWSPDGEMIAITPTFNNVLVLDVNKEKQLRTFKGTYQIRSLAWSPDGKTIAGGNDDGTLMLWDTSGERATRTLTDPAPWLARKAH